MKFSVAHAIDEYIESVTEDREPDGLIHPSSMFGCTRQTIYTIRGTEVTNAPDGLSKRRFYIGHRLHEAAQRAVESDPSVVECYSEFEINTPEGVTGHGDMLVKLKNGQYVVVEVKSIKKWGMKMGLPKEDHVQQARMYAWGVKYYGATAIGHDGEVITIPPIGNKLWGILMVYMEKEELFIKEYPIKWDPTWVKEIKEKLAELKVYKDDPDSLPPRLPYTNGKKDWRCRYCPFAKKCWNEDSKEVEPKMEEW